MQLLHPKPIEHQQTDLPETKRPLFATPLGLANGEALGRSEPADTTGAVATMPTENGKRKARYRPHQAARTNEAIKQPAEEAKPCATQSRIIEALEVTDGHKNGFPSSVMKQSLKKYRTKGLFIHVLTF